MTALLCHIVQAAVLIAALCGSFLQTFELYNGSVRWKYCFEDKGIRYAHILVACTCRARARESCFASLQAPELFEVRARSPHLQPR